MKWKRSVVVLVCFSALALAALTLAGCSDDSGGGGGGGSAPQTYDEFQAEASDEFVELICTAAFDCPEKQPLFLVLNVGRFADKQACLDGAGEMFNVSDGDARTNAAIEAGRVVYDPEAAKSCLSLVSQANSSCLAFDKFQKLIAGTECETFLVPQQEEGEPCNGDDECVTANCDYSQSAGECYGSCGPERTLAQEGDSCDMAECADGLVCVREANSSTCVAQESRGEGDACGGGPGLCAEGLVCGFERTCVQQLVFAAQGETCSTDGGLCKPGLVCADLQPTDSDTVEGTCAPPAGQGEECQQTLQCAIDLYCEGAEGLTPGTCEQPKEEGEACAGSSDECAGDLWCDTRGDQPVCTAEPESNVCEIPDDAGNNGASADTGTADSTVDAG